MILCGNDYLIVIKGSVCVLLVSLDRGRALLDSSERELLKEIRELRQKLAARARESSTTSSPSVPTPSSAS